MATPTTTPAAVTSGIGAPAGRPVIEGSVAGHEMAVAGIVTSMGRFTVGFGIASGRPCAVGSALRFKLAPCGVILTDINTGSGP